MNRFFDLPRTPWRSPRSAAAYLIAACGLLVFTASLAYLFLGGGVAAQADRLAGACGVAAAPCRDASRDWAWQALAGGALSVVGLKAGLALRVLARKLSSLPASQAVLVSTGAFALYLRPFPVDDLVLPKPALPALSAFFSYRALPTRMEEELFDVSDGYLPLIAVADPRKNRDDEAHRERAYRERLGDNVWQEYVSRMLVDAQVVIIVLSTTESVLWELQQVLAHEVWRKTLFLLEPAAREGSRHAALTANVIPMLCAAGLPVDSATLESAPLAFYFGDAGPVVLHNTGWSATSYRIAFAHFLAERAPASVP